MPLFHFHLSDGVAPLDPTAADYPDANAAQAAGVKYLGQLLADHGDQFLRSGDWQLVIADENGLTLYAITVLATHAPSMQQILITPAS